MAAAALGNTISDVAGIASVWYVEHFADKIGIPNPKLSALQLASMPVRWSANIGRALGVIIGCLLGMLPLLFLSTSEGKKEERKESKEQ
ncbi:unnamed protein product [Allacma fusca]|uniref:Transmembrane protein 65 n=1 Tax=Allacma fusca TaxID=39272 RepID=A0A8J2L4U7_9HEXA|nr:unnamed protein product [Allacma fusca]